MSVAFDLPQQKQQQQQQPQQQPSVPPPPTMLPPDLQTHLEAAAFRSLVDHLRERSDSVSNLEMMTAAGFCRNCLAKWMVLGARQMAAAKTAPSPSAPASLASLSDAADDLRALDSFGYDEAARRVYGTSYAEWKERHQRAATQEQLERYEASARIHAVHHHGENGDYEAGFRTAASAAPMSGEKEKPAVLSNVCCEDVEEVAETAAAAAATAATEGPSDAAQQPHHHHHHHDGSNNDDDKKNFVALTKQKSLLPASHPFATPPSIPRAILVRATPLKIAVLAASDRASRGLYPDGDLSIPAVERQVQLALGEFACPPPTMVQALVPDEADQIRAHLVRWTAEDGPDAVDLVLTTGGTGFAPRDVTPEATRAVLDAELTSLMPMVLQATAINAKQPLATLSRATAGIKHNTVVANLPGNPQSIEEIMPVLFPQLLHALVDVRGW